MKKEEKIKVYIAGPMAGSGDMGQNIHKATQVATDLILRGFVPILPHSFFFWHVITPLSIDMWIRYDLELVGICHALLRLPGKSPGADEEVKYAKKMGIPVFESLDSLVAFFGKAPRVFLQTTPSHYQGWWRDSAIFTIRPGDYVRIFPRGLKRVIKVSEEIGRKPKEFYVTVEGGEKIPMYRDYSVLGEFLEDELPTPDPS